jgi:hypothetical protein
MVKPVDIEAIAFAEWKDRVTAMMCLNGEWVVKKNSKIRGKNTYSIRELYEIWQIIMRAKAETKPFPLQHTTQ